MYKVIKVRLWWGGNERCCWFPDTLFTLYPSWLELTVDQAASEMPASAFRALGSKVCATEPARDTEEVGKGEHF